MAETTGIRVEEVVIGATLTVGAADSPIVTNDGRREWVMYALQGGGGVMLLALMVSVDGINFAQAGPALSAATIGTIQRTVYAEASAQGPIVEPFLRVHAVVTVASATGVFIDLIGA